MPARIAAVDFNMARRLDPDEVSRRIKVDFAFGERDSGYAIRLSDEQHLGACRRRQSAEVFEARGVKDRRDPDRSGIGGSRHGMARLTQGVNQTLKVSVVDIR